MQYRIILAQEYGDAGHTTWVENYYDQNLGRFKYDLSNLVGTPATLVRFTQQSGWKETDGGSGGSQSGRAVFLEITTDRGSFLKTYIPIAVSRFSGRPECCSRTCNFFSYKNSHFSFHQAGIFNFVCGTSHAFSSGYASALRTGLLNFFTAPHTFPTAVYNNPILPSTVNSAENNSNGFLGLHNHQLTFDASTGVSPSTCGTDNYDPVGTRLTILGDLENASVPNIVKYAYADDECDRSSVFGRKQFTGIAIPIANGETLTSRYGVSSVRIRLTQPIWSYDNTAFSPISDHVTATRPTNYISNVLGPWRAVGTATSTAFTWETVTLIYGTATSDTDIYDQISTGTGPAVFSSGNDPTPTSPLDVTSSTPCSVIGGPGDQFIYIAARPASFTYTSGEIPSSSGLSSPLSQPALWRYGGIYKGRNTVRAWAHWRNFMPITLARFHYIDFLDGSNNILWRCYAPGNGF